MDDLIENMKRKLSIGNIVDYIKNENKTSEIEKENSDKVIIHDTVSNSEKGGTISKEVKDDIAPMKTLGDIKIKSSNSGSPQQNLNVLQKPSQNQQEKAKDELFYYEDDNKFDCFN
ncbi:uncharacterized protein LOC126979102 [Leptidea sinapis]|uniref:Uncharacterized protein n=1 Tax=Leptidea sinapis TaxID=189913 RepID=A0A5E4PK50_9NEOP|nr:uncharacterized protein LOC126979102 [Leptidea sinapis]VVC86260.1 unnamed protein product [Leptidea sinapis]